MKKLGIQIKPQIVNNTLASNNPATTETLFKILSSTPCSDLYKTLNQSDLKLTPETVESVLPRLRDHPLLSYRFFRWSSRQISPNHTFISHQTLIESLAKSLHFDLVWDVVEHSMKPLKLLSVDTFSIIINYYARANRVSEAIQCFNSMAESHGVAHNQAALDGLLSALCKSGFVAEAQEVFDELKHRDEFFDPGAESFSVLIEGWGRASNVSMAREAFREMLSRGIHPDAVAFGVFVDVLCKGGEIDEAVEIVESMETPNSNVYAILINAYGSIGRIEDAEALYRRCSLGSAACNAMIRALVKAGRLDEAFKLMNGMKKGEKCETLTMNAVIKGLISRGESEEAGSRMQEMVSRGCEPDKETYAMMITMYCKENEVGAAMQMWRYMKRRGFVPGVDLYSALLNGLCRVKDAELASSLAEEMVQNGIRPSGSTFRRLSRLLKREGHCTMLQFLEDMRSLLPNKK